MIRHPLGHKRDGFCSLSFATFARMPRSLLRQVYRDMRRNGVARHDARHWIMQLVMAADWPQGEA